MGFSHAFLSIPFSCVKRHGRVACRFRSGNGLISFQRTVSDKTAAFDLLGSEYLDKVEVAGPVASILPFMTPSDGAFDDRATRIMGEAFDAAVTALRTEQPAVFYERIAKQIIAAANKGERDPMRLRNKGGRS
jgi:hypothetical protein